MLNLLTAPPAPAAAVVPIAMPEGDPTALGGFEFADVLTQLLAPSVDGQGADPKGLVKQALARPSTPVQTPAVVIDGAVPTENTGLQGGGPGSPRPASKVATTIGHAVDEVEDGLPVAISVIDMVAFTAAPMVLAQTPTLTTAPDASPSTNVPSPGSSLERPATGLPSAAAAPITPTAMVGVPAAANDRPADAGADIADTSRASSAPGTGAPQGAAAFDRKPIAAIDHNVAVVAVPATASAAGEPTPGAPASPRATAAPPPPSAIAVPVQKSAARSAEPGVGVPEPRSDDAGSAHTGVNVPALAGTTMGMDPESSRGEARSGGGHGQPLQNAPASGAPHDGLLVPSPVAVPVTNPGLVAVIGEGLAPVPLRTADGADLGPQIVQAIKLQWHGGIGDARIRLQPEYLGELTIAIRVERGMVTASLESDTSAVRQWLQRHESVLRQGLADQGLHLDRLLVSGQSPRVDWENGEKRQQPEQEEPSQDQQQPSRRRPDEQTFEVVA